MGRPPLPGAKISRMAHCNRFTENFAEFDFDPTEFTVRHYADVMTSFDDMFSFLGYQTDWRHKQAVR